MSEMEDAMTLEDAIDAACQLSILDYPQFVVLDARERVSFRHEAYWVESENSLTDHAMIIATFVNGKRI